MLKMSQVSKIEEAILIALSNAEVSSGTGLVRYNFGLPDDALDSAKQALLSAILEVKPATDSRNPHGAYNAALDEWEAAIKELFGVAE